MSADVPASVASSEEMEAATEIIGEMETLAAKLAMSEEVLAATQK